MQIITKSTYNFDKSETPVAHVADGEVVRFVTMDCFGGQVKSEDDLITSVDYDYCNPSAGPVYVDGAEPGDVIAVDILQIDVDAKGFTCTLPDIGPLWPECELRTRMIEVRDGLCYFNDISWPAAPMIGVIGVAPSGDAIPTGHLFDHGGNMDCNKIVEGSTLYLPVNVPGALLSMGDMHALMGDGEVMICGLESAGKATVRVSVVKGWQLPTPCLLHKGGKRFSTIQSDPDLMASAKKACNAMLDFLLRYTDLGEYDGGKLLSLKGDLAICHIINDLLTVRMEIDTYILDQYGIKLP